jgi:hypothetical protein
MVRPDLLSQDLASHIDRRLADAGFEPLPEFAYEDLPPTLRAEDEMIVNQEDTGIFLAIRLTNVRIILPLMLFGKPSRHAFIPPPKGWAFC